MLFPRACISRSRQDTNDHVGVKLAFAWFCVLPLVCYCEVYEIGPLLGESGCPPALYIIKHCRLGAESPLRDMEEVRDIITGHMRVQREIKLFLNSS